MTPKSPERRTPSESGELRGGWGPGLDTPRVVAPDDGTWEVPVPGSEWHRGSPHGESPTVGRHRVLPYGSTRGPVCLVSLFFLFLSHSFSPSFLPSYLPSPRPNLLICLTSLLISLFMNVPTAYGVHCTYPSDTCPLVRGRRRMRFRGTGVGRGVKECRVGVGFRFRIRQD